jgi:hypothetical protein
MANKPPNSRKLEFIRWLEEYQFQPYQQLLEEEGFDDLESLTLLSQEEIQELSTAIHMKLGHKKKFPVAIQNGREEIKRQKEEQAEKLKRDKLEQEEESAKLRREKERKEKQSFPRSSPD